MNKTPLIEMKSLSRDEMKKIMGGSCYGACWSNYYTDCTAAGPSSSWCYGQATSYCKNLCPIT